MGWFSRAAIDRTAALADCSTPTKMRKDSPHLERKIGRTVNYIKNHGHLQGVVGLGSLDVPGSSAGAIDGVDHSMC